jgi:preprotein translocase SecE subunit
VTFAFLALGLLAAMTLSRLLAGLFFVLGVGDAPLLGSQFTTTTLVGGLAGLAGAWYTYRHPKANEYASEVVGELKKVTWPGKKETQSATVVVIITTIIMAVVMALFDQLWGSATGVIYK